MKIGDITATLVKKAVVNVIYKEWLHDGHIDIEHTEDFRCVIDGKLYEITVREVGNDIGTDYEAYKIALTALRTVSREQVEKVWRGEWKYSPPPPMPTGWSASAGRSLPSEGSRSINRPANGNTPSWRPGIARFDACGTAST